MNLQFSENVRKFRTERGYTQSELAVLLSVSPQAVSRWENGQAYPDIELLPRLAEYLCVSIDKLMGAEKLTEAMLNEELYERFDARTKKDYKDPENEMRILDLYRELGDYKVSNLRAYFAHLTDPKYAEKWGIEIPEERVEEAREMIRLRLRSVSMTERMDLLATIAMHEAEERLSDWEEEYRVPGYIKTDFWEELMVSRYRSKNSEEECDRWNQKVVYRQIESALFYLTMEAYHGTLRPVDAERCRKALALIDLFSTRVDDVFLLSRIRIETIYAECLFGSEQYEEGLSQLAAATEQLKLLHRLPKDTVLCGSVPMLESVRVTLNTKDVHSTCIMHLVGRDRSSVYDNVRNDGRFTAFTSALQEFLPKEPCRSFMLTDEEFRMDPTWGTLLEKAKTEAAKLQGGMAVVMLTAKGNVQSISFRSMSAACDADAAFKYLIELKKNGDSKIKRIVAMWGNGGIDMPSFAFREVLLKVDESNASAEMLLMGLKSFVIKDVRSTMR